MAGRAGRWIPPKPSHLRLGAVIAVVIASGLGAYFLLRDDEDASRAPAGSGLARAVTLEELRSFAESAGHRVYWAGPKAGFTYELTGRKGTRLYVRYLPRGVPVGDRSTRHLTVGTYPWPDAYATTRAAGRRPGYVTYELGPDGVAAVPKSGGTNVYFARRGSDYQVEIFHPAPGRARALVLSGAIAAVDIGDDAGARAIGPRTASLQELRALPATVGHPVFWAGPRRPATYELTQTDEGRIYIRYLPPGVPEGTRDRRFLTVATYPQPNAFERTVAVVARSGVRVVKTTADVIAYFRIDRPTSVFYARRGLDYQVEVFDPSPGLPRRIVQTGRLQPIQ